MVGYQNYSDFIKHLKIKLAPLCKRLDVYFIAQRYHFLGHHHHHLEAYIVSEDYTGQDDYQPSDYEVYRLPDSVGFIEEFYVHKGRFKFIFVVLEAEFVVVVVEEYSKPDGESNHYA
jgi:hypothetical protein